VGLYRRAGTLAEQSAALTEITYGLAARLLPDLRLDDAPRPRPAVRRVQNRVDRKRGGFSVPDVLEVRLAPHVEPVSGNEQEVQVSLAKTFIWQVVNALKTAVMKITTPNLNFDHGGRNALGPLSSSTVR
jgi:hypothetical protein